MTPSTSQLQYYSIKQVLHHLGNIITRGETQRQETYSVRQTQTANRRQEITNQSEVKWEMHVRNDLQCPYLEIHADPQKMDSVSPLEQCRQI